MAWNGNFTSFPSTSIYSNDFNPFPEVEVEVGVKVKNNHQGHGVVEASSSNMNKNQSYLPAERKRRLTDEQIDTLERSFEEEIKLEPERKLRLSRELGLQPRQVAIWFQNRRARWRVKQIEHLYDALKKEFHAVTKENLKLQDEVMKLKAKLEDQQASTKQGSTGNVSAEEMVENKSVVVGSGSSRKLQLGTTNFNKIAECNYLFNVHDYNPSPSPYSGVLPASYP